MRMPAKQQTQTLTYGNGEEDLQGRGEDGDLFHASKVAQGEFHPQGEHQQGHPEFCNGSDVLRISDQSHDGGAHYHAGQEVTHQKRQPERTRQKRADETSRQGQSEVKKKSLGALYLPDGGEDVSEKSER